MKKLGKLSINPEKLIKNNELKTLRGGDYDDNCIYTCETPGGYTGTACGDSLWEVIDKCEAVYGWCHCISN